MLNYFVILLLITHTKFTLVIGDFSWKQSANCDHGWHLFNNNCYKVITNKLSWYSAEQSCRTQHGGHLMEILNIQHQMLANCLINQTMNMPVWIGLNLKDHKKVQWSSGSAVIFDPGSKGPFQWTNDNGCYMITRLGDDWKAGDCSSHLHYSICQYMIATPNPLNNYKNNKGSVMWGNIVNKVVKVIDIVKGWLTKHNSEVQREFCKKYVPDLMVNKKNVMHNHRSMSTTPRAIQHRSSTTSDKWAKWNQRIGKNQLKKRVYSTTTEGTKEITTGNNYFAESSGNGIRKFSSSTDLTQRFTNTPRKSVNEPTVSMTTTSISLLPEPISSEKADKSARSKLHSSSLSSPGIPSTTPPSKIKTASYVKTMSTNDLTLSISTIKTNSLIRNQGIPHVSFPDREKTAPSTEHPVSSANLLRLSNPIFFNKLIKNFYNLTPIPSHTFFNQSTGIHFKGIKYNVVSIKPKGNISWSESGIMDTDSIISSLKNTMVMTPKKSKKKILEMIRKHLSRKSIIRTSNVIHITKSSALIHEELPKFEDFFKMVNYFVNICHEGDWEKNELEDVVKEIAKNTDPYLRSSLSARKLQKIRKTMAYVDVEVMHVDVRNVFNITCNGKNGAWKVSRLKLMSRARENDTISISMILLNTPTIYVQNSSLSNVDADRSYLVSPLLSLVAYGNDQQLQISHSFSLKINTSNTNLTHDGGNWTETIKKEAYEFKCVFLDPDSGLWSDYGCEVEEETLSHVSCSCNHTTNFAILMQVRKFEITPDEDLVLSTISYIGCSISLITQFITIAVFTFIEILRCERTFVHRNLCMAIVGAQITFLSGIQATKYKIVCSIIALLLHYWYLCVFAWMLVEGLHLYSRVVRVFGSDLSRKIYYSIFGWGMPVLLVVISAAADWDGYGTDKVCWLSINKETIWAFVGPAIAIILVNLVILAIVTRIVMTTAKHGHEGRFHHVRAGVKGALFLLPILGMTWLFGLMSVNRKVIVFEYLFAISNSLQGFFIFLFHVVCNTEVRQALLRLREKRSLQRGDLGSTSSTTSWSSKSLPDKYTVWSQSRKIFPLPVGTNVTVSSTTTSK